MASKDEPAEPKELTPVKSPVNGKVMSYPLRVYPIRLQPREDLLQKLSKFLTERKIEAAFIVTCVGSVRSVHLRYATGEDGEEKDELLTDNMYICSLVGTCSRSGHHLHATLGKSDGTTVSGHVKGSMMIQTTAEVILGEAIGAVFSRIFDATTGFGELVVSRQH